MKTNNMYFLLIHDMRNGRHIQWQVGENTFNKVKISKEIEVKLSSETVTITNIGGYLVIKNN